MWGALDVDELVRVTLGTHKVGLKTVRCTLNDARHKRHRRHGKLFSVVNWMASRRGRRSGFAERKVWGLQVSGVDGNNVSMSMAPYDLRASSGTMKKSSLFIEAVLRRDLPPPPWRPGLALHGVGLDVIGRGAVVFDASESVMYFAKGDVGYGT